MQLQVFRISYIGFADFKFLDTDFKNFIFLDAVTGFQNFRYRKVPAINSNTDSAKALPRVSDVGSDSLAYKSKKKHHHADNSVAKQRDIKPRKTSGGFPGETTWAFT